MGSNDSSFDILEDILKDVEFDKVGGADYYDDEYLVEEDELDEEGRDVDEMTIDISRGYEEDKERARGVFRTATDRTLTSWFVSNKDKIAFRQDYACHADFSAWVKKQGVVASCFQARVGLEYERAYYPDGCQDYVDDSDLVNPIAERYWDFIMGSGSPWRMLFELAYPEKILHEDNKTIAGFFLEPLLCDKYPGLAQNLAIAARMIGEEREAIFMWDHLVSKGMERADALYLARMVKWKKGTDGPVKEWTRNDSSHWPLLSTSYATHKTFDFAAFREGRFNPDTYLETFGWCQAAERQDFNLGSVASRKNLKPNRDYTYEFELDDVIEEFYKWQWKYNQLSPKQQERIAA